MYWMYDATLDLRRGLSQKYFIFLAGKKGQKPTAFFTVNEIKSVVGCSGIFSARDGVMLRAEGSLNIPVSSYKNKASDLLLDPKDNASLNQNPSIIF